MSGLTYLQEQAAEFPAEEAHFTQLSDLYKDRLWFQLTEKLLELLSINHFQSPPHLAKLYTEFVKGFEKELKRLDLAQFGIAASKQYDDFKGSMKLLDEIFESVKGDTQAEILCKMEKVGRMIQDGQMEESLKILDETKVAMEGYDDVMDPAVHSAYYKAKFLFYKEKKNATEIFRNALLFLSYTPIDKIPDGERVEFAFDVSIAALTGRDIFNFGELLERPLVKVLEESKYSWTLELLEAFNKGDFKTYERVVSQQSNQPLLQNNKKFLWYKVRILRLIGSVFSRSSQERTLSFKEISETCDTKQEQVEFLVMKAFSLGVLRGVVDQVSQKVTIKWVQPRVLTMEQIKGMSKKLKSWSEELKKATLEVETHSSEILQ